MCVCVSEHERVGKRKLKFIEFSYDNDFLICCLIKVLPFYSNFHLLFCHFMMMPGKWQERLFYSLTLGSVDGINCGSDTDDENSEHCPWGIFFFSVAASYFEGTFSVCVIISRLEYFCLL